MLRAVIKGEDIWLNDVFHTLNKEEGDLATKDVLRLVETVKLVSYLLLLQP